MNNRYLKLKDAIEVVRETVVRETVADEYIENILELRLLDKSLTIDVRENIRGEWISTGFMEVKCSNCKETFHELESTNFCPNCGADMRGE